MTVGEGDDACSSAAGKVGGRALVMAMVCGPAVSTAPIIGAVAGLVSWVLAVTPKTIDMRGRGRFRLPSKVPGGDLGFFTCRCSKLSSPSHSAGLLSGGPCAAKMRGIMLLGGLLGLVCTR